MDNVIQESIAYNKELIAEYEKQLLDLSELNHALATWKGKNIDKRFFDTITIEGWGGKPRAKYHIGKDYDWNTKMKLYGGSLHGAWIEAETRETKEWHKAVLDGIEKIQGWKIECEKDVRALEKVDLEKIVADLVRVYKDNGIPDTAVWGKILDVYEVKYPKD